MNDKSKELQSKLNSIKTDIENEKKEFIDNCRKAQKKLNFDLSDSQVLRKMSSAIEIINDANTTYYAYLKTKLNEVKEITGAYDVTELAYQVVEQVYQLIHFINEESSIKNSFEGSLNYGFSSTDLGTMAVVSYSPTIEAKELELKWRDLFKKLPESKKQEYYEEKNIEWKEKSKYREKLAAWEKACEPITQKRKEYVTSVIVEKTKQVEAELLSKYTNEKKEKENQIQSFESTIVVKDTELKRLGVFKLKEKKLIQREIQEYQKKIGDLTRELIQLKSSYDESMLMSSKQATDCVEKTAKAEAEKRYPYPVAPDKPDIIKKEEREERRNLDEVLEALIKEDTFMSIDDLDRYFMGQKSRSELSKALRQGVNEGSILLSKVGRETEYCWAG